MERKNEDENRSYELTKQIIEDNPKLAKWILGIILGAVLLFVLPYLLGHTAFFLRECKKLKCAVKGLRAE